MERLSYQHVTLLTGTPIQNNTEELWTLMHVLDADKFGRWESFEQQFGELKESKQVQSLQAMLKPYLVRPFPRPSPAIKRPSSSPSSQLRRLKEDVEKSIAAKEETIIEVELTRVQKKYYRAILEKNFSNLVKGTKAQNLPSLMNVMMQLRKCCNHPYLLTGVEETELAGARPLDLYY